MNIALSSYRPDAYPVDDFACGVPALDDFIRNRASHFVGCGLSAVRVCLDLDARKVVGYAAISPISLAVRKLPAAMAERYGVPFDIPAWLIGKLAVDQGAQGQHLGELLLFDALNDIAKRAEGGAGALVIVDAKDKQVKKFYKKYGFQSLPNMGLRVFMTMEQVRHMLEL